MKYEIERWKLTNSYAIWNKTIAKYETQRDRYIDNYYILLLSLLNKQT